MFWIWKNKKFSQRSCLIIQCQETYQYRNKNNVKTSVITKEMCTWFVEFDRLITYSRSTFDLFTQSSTVMALFSKNSMLEGHFNWEVWHMSTFEYIKKISLRETYVVNSILFPMNFAQCILLKIFLIRYNI